MAVHWQNSVTINRPIDEIWAEFSDLFGAPRLPGASMSVRQTSPGPMGLGTTIQARRVILGFETRLTQEITEWDPPRAISVTIMGRPFRSMLERVTLEVVPGGTKLDETLDIDLRPALKVVWPIIGPFMRRQRQQAFRDLKVKLEAEGVARDS
ncbi:MAG: SRPBCC family protein [Chloroflexota bacterium]